MLPWVFLGAGVLAVSVYCFVAGSLTGSFISNSVEVVAGVTVLIAVQIYRPLHPWGWRLIGLAELLWAGGDIAWDIYRFALHVEQPVASYADVLYVMGYPALVAGVIILIKAERADKASHFVIDALIVVCAALIPTWEFLVHPAIVGSESLWGEVSSAAYPLMDLLIVVLLMRVLYLPAERSTALRLLTAGIGITLVADIVFLLLQTYSTYSDTNLISALWPLSALFVGTAALHPSMRLPARPVPSAPFRLTWPRLVFLGSALVAGPLVIFLHKDEAGPFIITMSLTVALLVVVRFRMLVIEGLVAERRRHRTERRFTSLVEHSSDAMVIVDPEMTVRYASPAIEHILGGHSEGYVGQDGLSYVHPADLARLAPARKHLVRNQDETRTDEIRIRGGDGSWHWVEVTSTNRLDDPDIGGIVLNFHDITERKVAQSQLATESSLLDMIAEGRDLGEVLDALARAVEENIPGSRCATLVLDESGQLRTLVAPTVDRTLRKELREIRPESAGTAPTGPEVLDHWSRELARVFAVRFVLPIRGSRDSELLGIVAIRTPPEPRSTGHEQNLLRSLEHVASVALERRKVEEELAFQALHDPLTGLPNRVLLFDRLHRALMRLEREVDLVGLVFIDLDRFKVINDSLGHALGDELLTAIAGRLLNLVRPTDTVARFGGDEFVILCEQLHDQTEPERLAHRIASSLDSPVMLSSGEVAVSASIGITVSQRSADRPQDLIRDADAAMHRAKARGGDRFEVFDESVHARAVERLETEGALRRAVAEDELRMYIQPQLDIGSRKTLAVEALIRWQHPTQGLLPPERFIGIAEETGLIVPVGTWMIDQACRHAASWRSDPRTANVTVSVNLAARQVQNPDLISTVERAIEKHGLDAEVLCFEVTESVLLEEVKASRLVLRQLEHLGIRLAIDDFGTGYSSLSYLKQFPFDELKIDKSFVDGLGQSRADDAIVSSTIQMAHGLDMLVVAEGVETDLQLERLAGLGCDRAQGFLFSPPRPIEFFPEFVRAPRAHMRSVAS
jgi:diguanylate cyclase (GGDEF)-like protein/PAS domain S-box-containing protein